MKKECPQCKGEKIFTLYQEWGVEERNCPTCKGKGVVEG
jgi:Zn ribbon nucleic-acid-binding protein